MLHELLVVAYVEFLNSSYSATTIFTILAEAVVMSICPSIFG